MFQLGSVYGSDVPFLVLENVRAVAAAEIRDQLFLVG